MTLNFQPSFLPPNSQGYWYVLPWPASKHFDLNNEVVGDIINWAGKSLDMPCLVCPGNFWVNVESLVLQLMKASYDEDIYLGIVSARIFMGLDEIISGWDGNRKKNAEVWFWRILSSRGLAEEGCQPMGLRGYSLRNFWRYGLFFLVLFRVIGLKRSNSVGLFIMKGEQVELCGWIAGKVRELGLCVKKLCLRMD